MLDTVSGQQQYKGELARRGDLCHPAIRAGRRCIGENEVSLAAVPEQRQEIRNDPVDGFDDPRKIENRQIGGDLDRGPVVSLLQKMVERLGNQASGLPNTLDDIDEGKEHHEPADLPALFPRRGGAGRCGGLRARPI